MRTGSIQMIRRDGLSRASLEADFRCGLRRTTLDKAGEIARVSKGAALHHLKYKGTLLEAVFRRSNSLLSESFIELCKYAETPYERLWAIVVANFFERYSISVFVRLGYR